MKDLNPLTARKDASTEATSSKTGLGFVASFLSETAPAARTSKNSDYAYIGMNLF